MVDMGDDGDVTDVRTFLHDLTLARCWANSRRQTSFSTSTALLARGRRGIMTRPTRTALPRSFEGGTPVRIRLLLVAICVIALLASPSVVSPAQAQRPTPQVCKTVNQTPVLTMDK